MCGRRENINYTTWGTETISHNHIEKNSRGRPYLPEMNDDAKVVSPFVVKRGID
jgi:hypothetical protein